jgi:hypothetical protein
LKAFQPILTLPEATDNPAACKVRAFAVGRVPIFNFLHALIADFGKPSLEGFCFGAGDRLDDAKGGLGVDGVGFVSLAICAS